MLIISKTGSTYIKDHGRVNNAPYWESGIDVTYSGLDIGLACHVAP